MKNILNIILLLLAIAVGILATRWWYTSSSHTTTEEANVLLERIENVSKLVTVEGYFTEVYDYKDYQYYDLPFFRKKALIRIKAKVSVGFDLSKMKLETFPETRTIRMSQLPKAEIVSIEDKMDYYDITEGTFNGFTTEDYNKMTQKAKDIIRQRATESDLMQSAERQGIKNLDIIRLLCESSGWKLEINKGEGMKN